jgi:CheY-like chemotaxis protein
MASVLIVDDDNEQRQLLADVLKLNGLDALQAADGEEGIDVAMASIPDVILLDIVLPGMSGLQVAEILTHDEATRDIPIVAISGLSTGEIRQRALAAGCRTYFLKPFTPMALVAEVKYWINKAAQSRKSDAAEESR